MATTQESFEALLSWLHPGDREAAGQAYEVIRNGLLTILVSKGFNNAEDLADETIERVISRVPDIRDTYEGAPANYFHGVLRNVIREQQRNREIATDKFPVQIIPVEKTSEAYDCLVKCLRFLPNDKRELILDYYAYHGHNKIVSHGEMAEELGISENALRIRACKIRSKLEGCVQDCLTATETKTPANAIDIESVRPKTDARA